MTQSRFRLWPAELFILKLSAGLVTLDVFLILLRGVAVDAQRRTVQPEPTVSADTQAAA